MCRSSMPSHYARQAPSLGWRFLEKYAERFCSSYYPLYIAPPEVLAVLLVFNINGSVCQDLLLECFVRLPNRLPVPVVLLSPFSRGLEGRDKDEGGGLINNFACLRSNPVEIATNEKLLHLRSEEHTSELQSLRHLVCR